MIGSVFGRWTAKSDRFIRTKPSGDRMSFVSCECSCGLSRDVNYYDLINGNSMSCGCLKVDAHTSHGMYDSPEYQVWATILQRCRNPKNAGFQGYGARGIGVDDEWLTFSNFYRDMGNRPSNSHTVERIDNNGNYGPKNCRWATQKEQSRNKRSNKLIEYNGQVKCVADWNDHLGFGRGVVGSRLLSGWSIEEALETPPGKFPESHPNAIKYRGKVYSIAELSREFGIKRQTLAYRLKMGWEISKALNLLDRI